MFSKYEYRWQHNWRMVNTPNGGQEYRYALGLDYVERPNPMPAPQPQPRPLSDKEIEGIVKLVSDVASAGADIGTGLYEEGCKPVFWWCNSVTKKLFGS